MSSDRPAEGGGNLRRGLRGALDLPRESLARTDHVDVTGWVFHERAEVILVVVLVDGVMFGTTTRTIERGDVRTTYPSAELRSGWSTVLDLGRVGERVTISTHALVAAPATQGQPARTVLLPFGERTLEVNAGRARGDVVLPERTDRGTLRVEGTADIYPALARVEVSLDGATPATARHSLPSGPDRAAGTEGRLRGFSATLEVPPASASAGAVDVRVTAVATDGTRGDLETTPVELGVTDVDPDATERRHLHGLRLEEHLAALRSTCAPGRRVLVAAHDLGIGGAQGYLDDLMQGLAARGFEFCVVSDSDGPLLRKAECVYGAPVMVLGPTPENPELLATRLRLIAGFAVEHGAAACLANTLVAYPAVLAASRLGIPTAWAIHESFTPGVFWHEYLGRPAHPAILEATREALASSDAVLFVADATRHLYEPFVRPGAGATVAYGLDVSATDRILSMAGRDQARTQLGIPLDHRILLCVGSVEPRKAQLALVRAFGRLGGRGGPVSLYIVGASDTAYVHALRDFVQDAELDQVHVLDTDPDILRWYAAADVLVSAADVESMPRTMLEAMMAGRPVAATAVFGVPELVQDGINGWLCEPGDLSALTELLRRTVTAAPDEIARLGAAARAWVEVHHTATGFVDHVGTLLETWLEGNAG